MDIKNSFFEKGNTEFYDFDVNIAFVTEEERDVGGYYMILSPILKHNKEFTALKDFKHGYILSKTKKQDDSILDKILFHKKELARKYIEKSELRLREEHLKDYLEALNIEKNKKDDLEEILKENVIVESINYVHSVDTNSDDIELLDIEKNIIACHEAGHAIIGFLEEEVNIYKVSIIPNKNSLGHTVNLYKEDRYLYTETELNNKIKFLLAGKVAETLLFSEHSTGAYEDLEKSSKIAFDMVCKYGMGNRTSLFINPISKDNISQEDIKKIENILSKANKEVLETLELYKDELKTIASELCKKGELDIEYIKSIVPKSKVKTKKTKSKKEVLA